MDVNDNAGFLRDHAVQTFFASKLALQEAGDNRFTHLQNHWVELGAGSPAHFDRVARQRQGQGSNARPLIAAMLLAACAGMVATAWLPLSKCGNAAKWVVEAHTRRLKPSAANPSSVIPMKPPDDTRMCSRVTNSSRPMLCCPAARLSGSARHR